MAYKKPVFLFIYLFLSLINMNSDTRRNSFSTFMKNLLLLVSPSNQTNEEGLERKLSTTSENSSPFQDLYFSFPAFEEPEESTSTYSSQSSSSYAMARDSSRIMF